MATLAASIAPVSTRLATSSAPTTRERSGTSVKVSIPVRWVDSDVTSRTPAIGRRTAAGLIPTSRTPAKVRSAASPRARRRTTTSAVSATVAICIQKPARVLTILRTPPAEIVRAIEHVHAGDGMLAPIGRHELSLAVMPHAGDWRTADVTAEALRFNAPLLPGRGAAAPRSFPDVPGGGLLAETVKRAEDGDGLVVGLYEPHGGRGTGRLRIGVPFSGAALANLLEEPVADAVVEGADVLVPYTPFQIVTVVLGAP
jgi:hypothetical protein